MPAAARFSLDAFDVPFTEDIAIVAGDDNEIPILIVDFGSTDAVLSIVFTAKLAATDADTASTTVQKTITLTASAAGQVIPLSSTAYEALFILGPVDQAKLLTQHLYDVKVTVRRGGSTYAHTVQNGKILATQGITGLTTVVTLSVSPSPAAGFRGQTTQLTATPRDALGNLLTGKTITWQSSDPTIATVDANGLVTTVAYGSCTITGTCEGISAQTVLSVTQALDGSVADVQFFVGDPNIKRWADLTVAGTVTMAGAKVTAVADPRGAVGFGPPLVGSGTSGPTIDPDGGAVIGIGTDSQLLWDLSLDLDMGQSDWWIAAVVAATGTGGGPCISLDDGATDFNANAHAIGFGLHAADGTRTPHADVAHYARYNFHDPFNFHPSDTLFGQHQTAAPSDLTTYRLVILEKHRGPGCQVAGVGMDFTALEIYGAPRMHWFNATPGDFPSAVACLLRVGHESGLGTQPSKIKAIFFGTGVLPVSSRQSLARYAFRLGALQHATANALDAVPTKYVPYDHDSNSAGVNCTSPNTDAHPVQVQTALDAAFPGVFAVSQNGWQGTTTDDHDNYYSRLTGAEINTQVFAKIVHVIGTLGANDLFAVTPANTSTDIIARWRSMGSQSRALGAKVYLYDIQRTGTNDETNNPAMAAANIEARTNAIASGYADAVFDLNGIIGAPSTDNIHFDTAENTEIKTDTLPTIEALGS